MALVIGTEKTLNQEWGWVQEMYAFALAMYMSGLTNVTTPLNIMAQPPWDTDLNITDSRPYYILHYTYGMDYTLNGTFTPGKYGEWRFDKRVYGDLPPKKELSDPPNGTENDLVRLMISMFNLAMNSIPCWEAYSQTGIKPECN